MCRGGDCELQDQVQDQDQDVLEPRPQMVWVGGATRACALGARMCGWGSATYRTMTVCVSMFARGERTGGCTRGVCACAPATATGGGWVEGLYVCWKHP